MRTVTVTAIQSFEYDGRTYHRGDRVITLPAEAAALARRRCVSLDRGYNQRDLVAAPVAEVVSEVEPPRRRRYRRRDMTAEGTTE